jgi:hypothetical protein
MSAYLAGVAAQHVGAVPTVRPRPAAFFAAPIAPAASAVTDFGDDVATADPPPAPVEHTAVSDPPPARPRTPREPAPTGDRASGPTRPVAELVPTGGLLPAAPPMEPAAIQARADVPRRIEAGNEPDPIADAADSFATAPASPSAPPSARPPATGVLLPRAAASIVVASPAAPVPSQRRPTQAVTERHETASTVQVMIGRIEVRAASPVSAARERPSGPRGVMSLDEYVAQRRGSAR